MAIREQPYYTSSQELKSVSILIKYSFVLYVKKYLSLKHSSSNNVIIFKLFSINDFSK